ncbi:MAG: hypothetical protein JKY98_05305 [Gammaproteobacteria bacterium]|nr:hypothetical protein [Gammaproteobacteria bacterium]
MNLTVEERCAVRMWQACHLAAVSQCTFTPADCKTIAAYLVVTLANVPGAVLARALGVSKQYISKQLQRVETLRDEPSFDQVITAMEETMGECL